MGCSKAQLTFIFLNLGLIIGFLGTFIGTSHTIKTIKTTYFKYSKEYNSIEHVPPINSFTTIQNSISRQIVYKFLYATITK